MLGGRKMSTTKLYVEYIIIGIEALFWIVMIPIIILGQPAVEFLKYCVTNIFSTIVLLGVCYIVGLEIDRLSDLLLSPYSNHVKKKHNMKNKTSIAIWEKYPNNNFPHSTLSRIRILRATGFNSIAIFFVSSKLIQTHYNNAKLLLCNRIFFGALVVWSFIAYGFLINNYYKKSKELAPQTSTGTATETSIEPPTETQEINVVASK